jgi:ABC-2 type transport system ATP-binding protein
LSPVQTSTVLQTFDLVKRYGDLLAVDSLSLEVFHGEVFGFLGPNGAGKTTSIHMMCGLLKPDSGRVVIHGKMIEDDRAFRTHVGLCPQDNIYWPKLTCYEQMRFLGDIYNIPRKISKKRINQLLDKMGLSEKRNKLANTLSGGLKRRLNICMAVLHDPEIIVFDEPEAGLDPQSRIMVRQYIKELAREKTIIMTTHNMDEAERLADRVAIIDRGRLLKLDTPDNLKKQVGQGDTLEISLRGEPADMEPVISQLNADYGETKYIDGHLFVRGRDMIDSIPQITESLKSRKIGVREIKLRENTLEDVFIHLTGKKLRD